MKFKPLVLTAEDQSKVDKVLKEYLSGTTTGLKGIRILWVGTNVLLIQHKPCTFWSGVRVYSYGWVDLVEYERQLTSMNERHRITQIHDCQEDGRLSPIVLKKLIETAQEFDRNYEQKIKDMEASQEAVEKEREQEAQRIFEAKERIAKFIGGKYKEDDDEIVIGDLTVRVQWCDEDKAFLAILKADFLSKELEDLAEKIEPFAKAAQKVRTHA